MKNCNNCYEGTVTAPRYNKASACEQPPTQLRTVTIPASKGGDGPNDPYAPALGAWRNTIVVYEKTKSVYLYDVNGVYTNLTGTDWGSQIQDILDRANQALEAAENAATDLEALRDSVTAQLEEIVRQVEANRDGLAQETRDRIAGDENLQKQLEGLQERVNEIGSGEAGTASDLKALQDALAAEAKARADADEDIRADVARNTEDIEELKSRPATGGMTDASLSGSATDNTVTLATVGGKTDYSHVSFKTVGGQSLIGEGDIPVSGGGGTAGYPPRFWKGVTSNTQFPVANVFQSLTGAAVDVPEPGLYYITISISFAIQQNETYELNEFTTPVFNANLGRAREDGEVIGCNIPMFINAAPSGILTPAGTDRIFYTPNANMIVRFKEDNLTFNPVWRYLAYNRDGSGFAKLGDLTVSTVVYTGFKIAD